MNNLTKYALSDLYDIASGISSTKEQAGHGAPFLSFSTVFNNFFLPSELPDLMETSLKEQEIFSIKEGDVFFTRTSETVDELAMSSVALKSYPCATFSGFLKRLRPKKEGLAYPKFMAFYFRSSYFRKLIDCNTIMTLRASFNEDIFSFLNIYLPNHSVQKKVGDFLFCLEAKMQQNARINDNLEQQLRTIYDYWFTQFDFPDENGKPYRSSGGKMVWNDELKREIPDGWECRTLGSLLHRHQQAFDYKSEQPTIDLSIMPSSSIAIAQTNSSSMFATNLYWMDEGDLLFGSIRPYLKKAGIAPCDGVVAGTVHCFQVNDKENYNFALFTLCSKNIFDYAIKVSKGTKMPVVSAEDILSYKVPYSKEISRLFNAFSIQKTICNNVKEIHKLTKLRDWLLPMLMNGQATVAD